MADTMAFPMRGDASGGSLLISAHMPYSQPDLFWQKEPANTSPDTFSPETFLYAAAVQALRIGQWGGSDTQFQPQAIPMQRTISLSPALASIFVIEAIGLISVIFYLLLR